MPRSASCLDTEKQSGEEDEESARGSEQAREILRAERKRTRSSSMFVGDHFVAILPVRLNDLKTNGKLRFQVMLV